MVFWSNSNNDFFDLNESKVDVTLHVQQNTPLNTSINYTLPKETLKTTSNLIVTNTDISYSKLKFKFKTLFVIKITMFFLQLKNLQAKT